MIEHPPVADTYDEPTRDELVTFTVLCQPASGIGLAEFRRQLTLSSHDRASLDALLPTEITRARVMSQLQARGFEVIELPGRVSNPVIFGRGSVERFEATFGGRLAKLTRHVSRNTHRHQTMTAVVFRPGTQPQSFDANEGVLLVTMSEPPLLAGPPTTKTRVKAPRELCLHLPAGVARATKASRTHRRMTPGGELATGAGVAVALIDTGFARHPFFTKRAYRITRIAAPDTQSPDVDDFEHGTAVLANLLACAPDADVFAIKYGPRLDWAFACAMFIPNVRVISLSVVSKEPFALPDSMLALKLLIGKAVVEFGVTVISATGEDDMGETFPPNMPTVISVGGVSVGVGAPQAWPRTASFQSKIFPGRSAPDLCGVGSEIRQPIPPEVGTRFGWRCGDGGTSMAAPQVAGIAALLIQKNPSLTPDDVRQALMGTSTDVRKGHSQTHAAGNGRDLATGAGLVNALKAWLSV
ncbi:MAG TPA: S8 family serine peptidase [Vicinamibacterales bacterium]